MSLLDQIERYEGYSPLDFLEAVGRNRAAQRVAQCFGREFNHIAVYDFHRENYERTGSERERQRMLRAVTPVVSAEISRREDEAIAREKDRARAKPERRRQDRLDGLLTFTWSVVIALVISIFIAGLVVLSHSHPDNPLFNNNSHQVYVDHYRNLRQFYVDHYRNLTQFYRSQSYYRLNQFLRAHHLPPLPPFSIGQP